MQMLLQQQKYLERESLNREAQILGRSINGKENRRGIIHKLQPWDFV